MYTCDVQGHMIKIEALTVDDSRSCNKDRFPGEKKHKEG